MSINLTTRKRLWSRAGSRCAFPDCPQLLFVPTEGTDDEIVVGKECHIVAQSDDGPRSVRSLGPSEQDRWAHLIDGRDGYANLILLCGVHHDVVDGDVSAFSIERLVTMKEEHEQRIDKLISARDRRDGDQEIRYAGIIDEWARRIEIDFWDGQMSRLVTDGVIDEDTIDRFLPLRDWLLRRVWPRTLPELEAALLNFRLIAEDLEAVVGCFETRRNGMVLVDRVHKEVWGTGASRSDIEFLERRGEYYRDLAADLTIELTRAVNLVCERVREHLWPNYRLDVGYTTVGLGMNMDLSYTTLRPLYDVDVPDVPYPGLQKFIVERTERDYAIGSGLPPEGAGLPGVGSEEIADMLDNWSP